MPAGYVDTELAWAAGFFDGEGTICTSNDERQRRITVSVSQAGEHAQALLNRFKTAVGDLGKIYKHKQPIKHWKQQYSWRVSAFKDVQLVVALLLPYLGPYKISQYEKCLEKYVGWKSQAIPMTTERGRKMAEKRWDIKIA